MISNPLTWLVLSFFIGAHTQVVHVGGAEKGRTHSEKNSSRVNKVSAEQLNKWARQKLAEDLPAGVRILDVSSAHGIEMPSDASSARLAFDAPWSPGVHAGYLIFESPGSQKTVPLRVALAATTAPRSIPAIKRGAEVMVVVRSKNVLVQSAGVSQESGAIGEKVSVLPQSSQRIVRGTVLDAKTVEVSL